jgi:hypothetical protein
MLSRSRTRTNRSHTPEASLAHAKSLVNRTNLSFLWKISARLSLHNMYTQEDDPFFLMPLLSPEDIRLLGQVILSSNAGQQYDRRPAPDALRRVLNDCKDMMNNPQALERMMRFNETDRAHLALQIFLSETANTQFPGQDPRPEEKAGRTLAIFEVLPRQYPEKMSRESARLVSSLMPRIEAFLGTSFTQLSLCFLALMNWQGISYHRSRHALAWNIQNPYAIRDLRNRRMVILGALFEDEPVLDDFLIFTGEQVARAMIQQSAWDGFHQQFAKFLRFFSSTTEELRRNAAEQPEFQVGSISNRLSPLERYPIVRIGERNGLHELIIPNVSHFLKSFSAVIDYTLLTELGNDYSQARGALLELYIRCLVENRLPHLLVIPEVAYGHEVRRGPDLTLIDRELGRIVLVEIKGRRILLGNRLNMTEEGLRANLEDAHSALSKLPRKLEDLYAGLSEYRDYQEAIDSTRGSTPIFVAIISEGVYSLGEIVREMGNHPGDPLYEFPFPYCVVALDIFERAVETARIRSEPLIELLFGHWQRSLRREYQNAGADSFGGSHIPESESFAGSFAPWH